MSQTGAEPVRVTSVSGSAECVTGAADQRPENQARCLQQAMLHGAAPGPSPQPRRTHPFRTLSCPHHPALHSRGQMREIFSRVLVRSRITRAVWSNTAGAISALLACDYPVLAPGSEEALHNSVVVVE